MKRLLKITVLFLFAAFLLVQLLPRPSKNISKSEEVSHISKVLHLPDSVNKIFSRSCYDCHSNNTRYPWYSSIQPLSIWLNHHIEEGKEELNFSEFANYEKPKQKKKIEEIEEVVSEGEMPLPSYTIIHRDASLSTDEKNAIVAWVNASMKTLNTP